MPSRIAVRERGFTLLELLVVLFIIGITLAFATLTIDDGNDTRRLEQEAERLEALMRIAGEDAVLFGLELGLDLTPQGYRFLRLDADGWQPVTGGDSPLGPRELPAGMELRLLAAEDNERQVDPLAPRGANDEDEDEGEDDRREGPRPEVLFLSSGELLPFQMELYAEALATRFLYEGKRNGKLVMRRERPAGS